MSDRVDRGFQARNDAARHRLAQLLDRLAPADLDRVTDGWTVGTHLAHLAFWDRFILVRWQEAEATGRELPLPFGPPLFDLVNAALEPEWARLGLEAVRSLVLDAAEALDAHIAALPDARVRAVLDAQMARTVDRSAHRASHLDLVEAQVPAG